MLYDASSSPILITGATQRLGLAIAEHLLAQKYSVIVTYRTHKPSVDYLIDLGATLIQCDFEHSTEITSLIDQLKQDVPSLRGIIHNASDWGCETKGLANDALLTKMMKVHVHAPYLLNCALKDKLLSVDGFADIIHMTDYVQQTGSDKHIAYAASKAALHNLTLSFAKKLAPHIKVNSIAPALVMFNEGDDDAYRARAKNKSLLQAVPGAQEAVKAVCYLLESEYITGQTLHLNGGRHLK